MIPAISFIVSAVVTQSVGEYHVSIVTDPRQGPFERIYGQVVQFSCHVDPTPSGTVSYHWRSVNSLYGTGGGPHSDCQNFIGGFDYDSLHYCYYFCEVSVNGILIGSARSPLFEKILFISNIQIALSKWLHPFF